MPKLGALGLRAAAETRARGRHRRPRRPLVAAAGSAWHKLEPVHARRREGAGAAAVAVLALPAAAAAVLPARAVRALHRHPGSGAALPRMCNELCYTLSVAGALDLFLRRPTRPVDSQRTDARALLLEDDICATTALLRHDGRTLVRELSAAGAPDVVKLGDCYRGVEGIVPKRRTLSDAEQLTTGACAAPKGARRRRAAPERDAQRAARRRAAHQLLHARATRRAAAHLPRRPSRVRRLRRAAHPPDRAAPRRQRLVRHRQLQPLRAGGEDGGADAARRAAPQNHGAALRLGEDGSRM